MRESMEPNEEKLILKDKQARLITALANKEKRWSISSLALYTNVTYVHTSRFISRCEELGIVSAEKHGRKKTLALTEKGNEIATGINIIAKNTEPAQQ